MENNNQLNNQVMRKVKISVRQVYHKYAEVEVFISNTIELCDIADHINSQEELYLYKLDDALVNADMRHGTGLSDDHDGMCEVNSNSEWRYDVLEGKQEIIYGGHL